MSEVTGCLEAQVDRFIPETILNRSPEAARQARFSVALAWVGGGLLILVILVQGSAGGRALLILNLVSAFICFAAPFILRRFGRPALMCHALLAVAFCKYVSAALFLRGAGLTGATMLLAQLPLLATFLTGIRAGAIWALGSAATGVGIGLLGRAGIISDHLPAANRLFNDHLVLVASTALLFSFAALYERSRSATQRQIYDLEARRQAAELERHEAVSKAQLAKAERLASLGRVAAATAHEINNPLSAVMVNLEMVAESLPTDIPSEISAAARDALGSARRIGRIVAEMGLCSQPRCEVLSAVAIADAVELAIRTALPHTRGRAQVQAQVEAALPPVIADLPLLSRVLFNLLVNAAQAIPEGQAAAHQIVVGARAAGGQVVVEICDSGHGIPAELFDKVREPFFTTRAIGEGAGLGLAMCEGILQSFGGSMAIESRPGRTVVRLTLAAAAAALPATPAESDRKLAILIVDDEEAVARALKRILKSHAVTFAAGGRQALDLLEADRGFDLIFCDLMMPELTGMDVFERLQASNRPLAERVVFMTGGTFTERARKFRESVPNVFLEKPFDVQLIRGLLQKYR